MANFASGTMGSLTVHVRKMKCSEDAHTLDNLKTRPDAELEASLHNGKARPNTRPRRDQTGTRDPTYAALAMSGVAPHP